MEGVGLLRSRMFKVLLAYIVDLANVLSNNSRKTKGFQLSSLSQVCRRRRGSLGEREMGGREGGRTRRGWEGRT
jgi:hypothetical protein